MAYRRIAKVVATGLWLAVLTTAGASAESIKIGLIGPMTGPGAAWGFAARASMEILADKTNASGGLDVGGKKYLIEIVAYDDLYKASEAVAAYQRLTTQDGVKYIIIQTSAPTMALKQNIEDDQVVALTTCYTPAAIDEKTKHLFRAYSVATDFVPPYAEWLKNNIKERHMATINPNDETGWSQSKTTERLYKDAGFTIVDSELYERSQKDFAPLLAKVVAANPDVVDLGASSPATAGLIVRQARDAGYKGRFVQTGGPGWLEVVKSAGKEAAEGTINVLYSDPNNAGYQWLAAEYKNRNNNQTPNEMVSVYYDAMSVLLAAIQKGGDVNNVNNVAAAIPAVLPMTSLQGTEMTYAHQQIRTYDYIGVLTDGVPVVAGKIK